MDTVRLGVIGCGNMAKVHMNAVGGEFEDTSDELRRYSAAVKIQGLCDVSEEKATEAQATYGAEYTTDDH